MRIALIATLVLIAGPAFAQSTSDAQSGSQANNNIHFGGGSNTPGVSAPGLAVSVGSCATTTGVGFGFSGFGFSGGTSVPDEDCNTRQDMVAMQATNQSPASIKMRGCANPAMARAFADAGEACPAHYYPQGRSTVASEQVPSVGSYTVSQAVRVLNDGEPLWDVGQQRWRYR